jgi:hypothetical protein
MKLSMQSLLFLLITAYTGGQAWANDNSRLVTVTLLPVMENSVAETPKDARNLLWVQKTPTKEIILQFDLNVLPAGLTESDFNQCTLRLVAQKVIFIPEGNEGNTGGTRVRIKGKLVQNVDNASAQSDSGFIVALSVLKEEDSVTLNQETSPEFRRAIYEAYSSEEKLLSLGLVTDSVRAGSLIYSSTSFGESPSNIPRLVINYTRGQPALRETLSWSQYQQNPEHTGRNPWIPFKNPSGFTLQKIKISKHNGSSGSIADYPLIYRGNIYIVNKISNQNYLVALDFKGDELWRSPIGKGTVQRSPVISRRGIFYIVTEEEITGYDLNDSGQRIASRYPHSGQLTGKLSGYTDLTIGNDGSLFLALKEDDGDYIYGFTHDLKPYVKSGPFGTGQDKISTITVSSDGKKIFAQTPEGATVINITNPSEQQAIILSKDPNKPWESFHTPVAGPDDGSMIFADFTSTANEGNVWGYKTNERLWSTHGTLIPQPVLGSNDLVYYIQGGGLQRHKVAAVGSGEPPKGKELNTTSNLVLDGADNLYFWDNGYLYGYRADAESLFEKIDFTKEKNGPESFIRFMIGPDGTLWSNNKNGNALFAFRPSYAETDLRLTNENDIKDQTFYRANDTLSVGAVTVKESTRVLFQARNGISFPKGFTVKRGAGMVCRTGF